MSGTLPTSVKTHHAWLTGSPQLIGAPGSAIDLFDAVLVTGWGTLAAASLVVSGDVATATFTAPHPFEADTTVASVVGITGPLAGLNGEHRVTATPTTLSIQFAAPGLADGVATGAVSLKVAPLGWTKVYAGTNKAVYKSSAPDALGMYLRVDDTSSTDIRVSGYESMTDVDTGTGQFDALYPTSGGGYWPKSASADTTVRNWIICGDERGFHFWCVPNWTTPDHSQGLGYWFGDAIPESSTDVYSCLMESDAVSVAARSDIASQMPLASTGSYEGIRMPRSYNAVDGVVSLGKYSASRLFNTIWRLSGNGPGDYPNSPNNALLLDEVFVTEGASRRAIIPGLLHSNQALAFAFMTSDKVDGAGTLAGRKVMALLTRASGYVSNRNTDDMVYPGCSFLDITGPWRN